MELEKDILNEVAQTQEDVVCIYLYVDTSH